MAKQDRENRGRSRKSDSSDRPQGGDEKKGGRSSYKAKRSFTRNKGFREKEKEEPGRRGGSREGGGSWGDRKKSFDKPAYRDRPLKRSPRGDEDKASRPSEDRERRPARDREEKKSWDKERAPRSRSEGGREKRSYRRDDEKPVRSHEERERRGSGDREEKKPWDKARAPRSRSGEGREKRSYRNDDEKPVRSHGERERRGSDDREEKKPWDGKRTSGSRSGDDREKRSFRKSGERDDSARPPRRSYRKDEEGAERESKGGFGDDGAERPRFSRDRDESEKSGRSFSKDDKSKERERPSRRSSDRDDDRPRRKRDGDEDNGPRRVKHEEFESGRSFERQKTSEKKKPGHANRNPENEGLTRLNKYLANAGLASRREADTLIQSGAVKVNGVVVDQLGYKIKPGDKVTYGDESVKGEKKVYLLLNKPKDYITTVDDPRERKTVMELIKGACRERVYPVGRLDRNTTGILLFTNDGELTTKLTHPKFNVKKVYHVTLDKNLKTTDFQSLVDGIELEDGNAKADDLAFVGEGKREVGIEIHSGRNRIVRRMFEHLGYSVIKLDRVVFAGLTKKDLPRGKHRFLTAKEISFLKMIG
jgi:23S rRNA pseudouridine2605 synthase